MATTTPKLITADELLQLHAKGVRGELIRGVLRETMPTGRQHGEIVMNLGAELRNFIKPRKLGSLVGSDCGVRLERDPDTVREPDIAYTAFERIPPDDDASRYSEVIPDLVVEVASPTDSHSGLNDKALMWLRYGVRLVWVVHPETRSVDVHREGHKVIALFEDDSLDGLDVLPGFTCAVSEVFEP